MKNIHRLVLLFTLSLSTANASATILTFEREKAPEATTTYGVWPIGYGDRVTTLSYIPANYASPGYLGPNPHWYYGAGGGFTLHIGADFRNTGDTDCEGWRNTSPTTADLLQTFTGRLASFGDDYLKVILTADSGYYVQLNAFDIANSHGNHPLHSLQVIVDSVWTEISRHTVGVPGPITFVDGMLPAGSLYRVRTVP